MQRPVLTRVSPARPYDLRSSAGGPAGGTRRWHGPVLALALATDAGPARAAVRQRGDGDLDVAITGPDAPAALDALRFVLATRDDHSEFLRMARRDPRMAVVSVRWPGYRPARRASVAQAVIAAACGQLVTGRQASQMERAVVRMTAGHADDGLAHPPSGSDLAALQPARAVSTGLAARRAAAMVRLARGVDLDRLHAVGTEAMAARVTREPWLGPWSAGVIGTYGLGRHDAPMLGDLGLMRIVAAETGRWPEADDTRALVQHYGEWSGLASAYLLRHPLARVKQGTRPARAA
jgi:3-methyladenine DNA glycosylase/8-oxoguanine DNA glycosylase